ncbi:ABC transporter substrate-binding protein [Ichthyenterobacterium sp. W332]|uniref:ABC transporter substrate-binding protein n=1 Tax=Microcosmobacter mediterraneus TaxID=3075607 RepID=A0ABU2YHM6_9FLAO|nr:ABC transporter substrate-binding protein [Ichthyenterobacterium sp. W332]MDT0557675.1 ABC transporter substrate-binding protein [Ichthyenterobacterium sp. W332]
MKKIFFLSLILLLSCKSETSNLILDKMEGESMHIKYAEGFSVKYFGDYKVLTIKSPWPKSQKVYKYAITNKNSFVDYKSEAFESIIDHKIKSIVVTSTTHIPALELLGIENALVGFPGCDYISSKKTRTRIDNGLVRELGKNEGINTEVILDLQPDLVVGFGVDGVNKTFETISKANIPVLYNGDWVEKTPLAKAEWIKFFGVLFNKEQKADSIFKTIETNYRKAQLLTKDTKRKPTILSGAMYKDVWYLPNGSSPEAQFLKDANVNYLWENTYDKGSLALSFETVFNKAKSADIWLSPSYYTSYEDLEKASELYTQFDAFKTKQIYSFSNTKGKNGGVLYYELGTARPDLVLKDIIKVCHPKLLPDYTTVFFKPLQ